MLRAKRSISGKISLLLLTAVFLSTIAVGVFSFFLHRNDSIQSYGQNALNIAIAAAAVIDPVEFASMMVTLEKNDYWYKTKAIIDEMKIHTGVAYIYILDSNYSDTFTYFMEGALNDGADEALDLGYKEDIFQEGENIYAPETFEVIASGQPAFSSIYDSGEYGSMLSGIAPILDAGGNVIGIAGVDISVEHVLRASNNFGFRLVLIILSFCLIFSLISRKLLRGMIGRPISELTDASGQIAAGNLQMELTLHSNDEIGRLADSFRSMVASSREQAAALGRLASGDLTLEVHPRSGQDAMNLAMADMIGHLNQMFAQINHTAEYVASESHQMADNAQVLAEGSTEQSGVVEQLSHSIAEVADQAKRNAEMAIEAASLANSIKESAQMGSQQMDKMTQAVEEINESSRKISQVIKIIDDIAFQTNILALNASVEAARAGQHGKGFAVVAEEVRNLAGKSAAAAKDTGALIEDSMLKAKLGTTISLETAASLADIVKGIGESSRIIGNIAHESGEQSAAIEQINAGIDQVARVVQQTSAGAQQSAAISEEMRSQSEMLKNLVSQFTLASALSPGKQ